jgi:hypothetical protein
MCKEDNLKLLKKIQSLSFQISIYEARKNEYDSLTRELESLLKENFTLTESMKTIEKFSDEQAERIARLTAENRCLKLALESRKEGSDRDSTESKETRNRDEEYFNCEDLEFEGKSIDAQILDFLNLPQDFIDYSKLHCKYVDLKLKCSHKKRQTKKEILELKSKNVEMNEKLFEISRDYKLLVGQHTKLNSDYKQITEKVKTLNEIIAQQSYIIHSKSSEIPAHRPNLSSRQSQSSEHTLDLPKSEIDKEVEELELKFQFIRKHALASRPAYSSESVFEMTPIKIPQSDLKQFDSPSTDISLLEDFSRFLDSQGKKASPSTIE